MTDDLLTAVEAARILGISTRTLREHVRDGAIARIVVGRGKIRKHSGFDPVDIEAFKRARKEYGAKPCPSTSLKTRDSTPMISNGEVVDFTALRERRTAATPPR